MVSGSCLCGAVGYEVDGRISAIVLCHCSKCRKANGSAFHAGAVCRQRRFRFTRGADGIGEFHTESGYQTRFCRRCGSPVPWVQPEGEYVVLPAGSFDADPGTRPEHHIFVGSKAPWYEIHDALPRHEAHGPDRG